MVILVLTSDLSFKAIGDFQGQSYVKHAISALLLPVKTQYVLPSYRKSWQYKESTGDIRSYIQVICDFKGTNHQSMFISISICIICI